MTHPTDDMHEMIAFLCGETELHGVSFNEIAPGERGKWWWRPELRRRWLAMLRACKTGSAIDAQCCMCGKKGLSTVEDDGGDECQLTDGRWTCSNACYCKAVYAPDARQEGWNAAIEAAAKVAFAEMHTACDISAAIHALAEKGPTDD